MKMEKQRNLATQRFLHTSDLEPSKEFKMRMTDIMSEARLVEYEYQRRHSKISRDTGKGHDASSLRDHLPLQSEAGSV